MRKKKQSIYIHVCFADMQGPWSIFLKGGLYVKNNK